jgi:hypothetical protein
MAAGATRQVSRRWMAAWLTAALVTLLCAVMVALALSESGPATAAPSAPASPRPFRGLGTWVDMYSWSATFTGGTPHVYPSDIDAMAAAGVQTLYIQAASQTGPAGVLEPERLGALIARAHRSRMSVVVWYLPTLADPADDLARLLAISRLPADGVGVDIESLEVADVGRRNATLITMSELVRAAMPGRPLAAIVMPPTLLEVVNPRFWPDFPWRTLAPLYDAWLPMTYWTMRLPASGLADGYTYTADSVRRLRTDLGVASPEIAPIGGDAKAVDPGAADRFALALRQGGATGGSLYEWEGSDPGVWSHLATIRR